MLNEVREVLETFEMPVYYGIAQSDDGSSDWNYIVFNRDKLRKNDSRTGYTDVFNVAIIQEEYIEDGLAERVIDAVSAIKGVRPSGEDSLYEYTRKPNTDEVVEMCVIPFIRARKNDAL